MLMAIAPLGMTANADNDEQIVAENIMQHYFTALKNGDVNTLKSLFDGEILKKRLRLLNNPAYPEYLKNTYQGSTFDIVETRFISQGNVTIIAKISLGNQQTLYRKFLLGHDGSKHETQFRILSESAVLRPD